MKLTINEGLKRYFVETNAYNFVAFVDEERKAYPVFTFGDKNGKEWDELNMTLTAAKNGNYSCIEGCRDAYEVCADVDGDTSKIFNFDEDKYENVTEF
ncbi:hypothetical protein DXA02_13705 [Ruminococcus sp. AM54-1NS]|nr:hypothetical protein DXA02_13705 [Ruminococcus sp. AM54-1NS]